MSSKSLLFLAIALTATSVLGHAGSGLNANAQVGRRFESEADTSDSRYVSESESDKIPDCRIINARGVKKVIRSDGSVCRGADGRPTTEDDENDDDDNRTYDGNVPDPIEEESEDDMPETTQTDGYDENDNAADDDDDDEEEEVEEVDTPDSGYITEPERRGM